MFAVTFESVTLENNNVRQRPNLDLKLGYPVDHEYKF